MKGSIRLVSIVLAAGAGTRFGGCKQLARLHGRPLVEHALAAAPACGWRARTAPPSPRAVLREAGTRAVDCTDLGDPADVDTAEQLEALEAAAPP